MYLYITDGPHTMGHIWPRRPDENLTPGVQRSSGCPGSPACPTRYFFRCANSMSPVGKKTDQLWRVPRWSWFDAFHISAHTSIPWAGSCSNFSSCPGISAQTSIP